MANSKEDWIDFGKLEKELDQAVEKEARYWRENDAKFRAVEQRVETYEQFRDIVKAAHIKPLDKRDKIGEGKRTQPWNPYTLKTPSPEPSKPDGFSRKESSTLPTTSHAFTRHWKSGCKSTGEKYDLLTSLGAEQLGRIFRAEIGFGLLGDFVRVLSEQFQACDLSCIADILESLARTNRFGLSVDFLGKGERDQCLQLFQKMERECLKLRAESLPSLDHTASDLNTEDQLDKPKSTEQQSHQGTVDTNDLLDKLTSLREMYKT